MQDAGSVGNASGLIVWSVKDSTRALDGRKSRSRCFSIINSED
jgi:hypothetical protein